MKERGRGVRRDKLVRIKKEIQKKIDRYLHRDETWYMCHMGCMPAKKGKYDHNLQDWQQRLFRNEGKSRSSCRECPQCMGIHCDCESIKQKSLRATADDEFRNWKQFQSD